MTGIELQQRRAALGLSLDQLADALGEHPDAIQRWERMTGKLPRSLSQQIEWLLATQERDRLMKASGLEECPWMEDHKRDVEKLTKTAELERLLSEADAHAKTCTICQRREAFARTLPPLPSPPMSLWVRTLVAVFGRIERLPKWARPAAVGALAIGTLTIVRALFVVVFQRSAVTPQLFVMIAAAIGIGAYGGAVGGLAYSLVRERFRRFGRAGDYLTGIVCAYAYLLAFGIPIAIFTGEEMFTDPVGWLIFVVIGTVFGMIIGHSWFREDK